MTARRLWRWGPWVAIVAAVVVILAIGAERHGHATLDERVQTIAGQYRCPSCNGESAADSNTPTSIEIRNLIKTDLQQGKTTGQIRAEMVSDYGPTILESPQKRGLTLLVWVVPVVAVVVAVGGLALAFRRWGRRLRSGGGEPTDADRRLVAEVLGETPGDSGASRAASDVQGRQNDTPVSPTLHSPQAAGDNSPIASPSPIAPPDPVRRPGEFGADRRRVGR